MTCMYLLPTFNTHARLIEFEPISLTQKGAYVAQNRILSYPHTSFFLFP